MDLKLWECYFGTIGVNTGHAVVIAKSKERATELINEIHNPELTVEDIEFHEHSMHEEVIPFYRSNEHESN